MIDLIKHTEVAMRIIRYLLAKTDMTIDNGVDHATSYIHTTFMLCLRKHP